MLDFLTTSNKSLKPSFAVILGLVVGLSLGFPSGYLTYKNKQYRQALEVVVEDVRLMVGLEAEYEEEIEPIQEQERQADDMRLNDCLDGRPLSDYLPGELRNKNMDAWRDFD